MEPVAVTVLSSVSELSGYGGYAFARAPQQTGLNLQPFLFIYVIWSQPVGTILRKKAGDGKPCAGASEPRSKYAHELSMRNQIIFDRTMAST
jgi:hypothetical protein